MTLRINVARTWKLEGLTQQLQHTSKVDAWAYYCTLCDEVLLVARRFVAPKGVQAAFDGVCPDCGFDLTHVMNCEHMWLPSTRSTYVNTKYPKAALLLEEPVQTFERIKPRSAHLSVEEPVLTTGIDELDKLAQLTTGQFIVFQGRSSSASLTDLLCVRAQLNHPIGLNSNVIFIDGGNRFDVYAISNYAIEYGIEPKLVLSHIHISRAFTYFQLASLLTEKLSSVLKRYSSRFAIVSDITELFQDPEIKDKQDAYHVFQRALRSLSEVAELTRSLVIATSFRQNISFFDTALVQTAHTTILSEDHDGFRRFALIQHKSLPLRKTSHREDRVDQLLEDYMEGREWGEPSHPGESSSIKNSQN